MSYLIFCHKDSHTIDKCYRKAGIIRPSFCLNIQTPVVTVESQGSCTGSSTKSHAQARNVPGGGNRSTDAFLESDITGEIVQAVASNAIPGEWFAPHLFVVTVRLECVSYPSRIH